MGVKVIRIYQLDGVVNARLELVGSFFEVEVPAGPVAGGYINKRLTPAQLAEALGGASSPNHSNSLEKRYRYLTRAEIAANGGYGEAFEDLDYSTACIGTRVGVEFYQPDPAKPKVYGQVLVAVYDGAAPLNHYVHVDGSFRDGDLTPAKFVPAESAEAKYGYVRRDTSPATIKDWRVGELSIWAISGADQFATAKQAGGPWPAFTGAEDAYWLPAAPPAKPVPSLLGSDNTFTGTNTYTKQVTALDVLVSSVQNIALNTFGKLAAYVANLGLRAGATTTTDPAAPLSKLPLPGWALQQTGNVFSLLRDASKIYPGAGLAGVALSQGNEVAAPGLNVTTSPFIDMEGGVTITVGKPLAGVAFYDAAKAVVGVAGTVTLTATAPATARYFRFMTKTDSGDDTARVGVSTSYREAYYSLGRLPYTVSINNSYPDAKGNVTIPVGAIIAQFTGTAAAPQNVTLGQFYYTGTGLYLRLAASGAATGIDESDTATWRVVVKGGGAGGGGASYTDAQARAAQLGRSAPANTTTVTLTAEAPTDYGTIASGAFTIDATNCVVGKCTRFAVAAGGSAPVFTNPPSGQPYKLLGATYASGQAYSYSLLVCVDRIEVVTLND